MKTFALAGLVLLAACPPAKPAATPPVAQTQKRYTVPAEVGMLVIDADAFAVFARQIRLDLERESTAKDPEIAKARLFVLAMLEALDDHWDRANALVDQVAALESAPETKAMTGLTLRAWFDARGDAAKFRAAFEARVNALPREQLEGELSMLRTMGQVFTPEVCRQLVNAEVTPHVKQGTVTLDQAHAIVFQRYAVVKLVPVAKHIDDVLGAFGVQPVQPATK